MKTVTVHQWQGMRADVYRLEAGDKIARHSHPFSHTTGVAHGSTKVTLFEPVAGEGFSGTVKSSRVMEVGDSDFAFPANVEHEIEALEDGTTVVNLSHSSTPPGEPGKDGGITFDP
jgi:quercetin dioxygenase-like cupin family protein